MPNRSLISQRAVTLKPSLTLAISARAKALKQQGKDICSLSAGEPSFETPEFIVEETIKALRDGYTRYGPAAGDEELRMAIAKKLTEENLIPTDKDNVLVTNGGKQSIYNLLQVVLNPLDEVLIPSPYWLSYPEMVRLTGAKPVFVVSDPKNGFQIKLDLLESLITSKTKLLILNSPGNPTGRIMSKQEMEGIAEILRMHPQILVLSDEIYEFLLAEGQTHKSFAAIGSDIKDRVITVNGFAKGWAMTGWRLGYMGGPSEIIKAATALQSQSTSNVCSFAQRGAIAALNGSRDCVKSMAGIYNERRKFLSQELTKIEEISLVPPKGAFYAFPQLAEKMPNSVDFCQAALEKVGLALIPGAAFGDNRCIRISCAASIDTIKDGIDRLNKFIKMF